MKNQFGTNDLKVIIAYLYIDMAHRKENPSDDKEISPVPPCRTSGGNQERSRKKGIIIKFLNHYNFVELFPQLKILLTQQRKHRKAERRMTMKLEDFETELDFFDSFTKERFPESSQGYTQEYRLYLQIKPNGNVVGYAVGESHCGHGQGCFWSDEEIRPCTLEEYNSLKRA
nr:MAG TPA: hypothetical protein [Caudoviricetes sp.]